MVLSANGVPIRLTEERWFHITKHHPELKRTRSLVLRAVSRPERLFYFAVAKDLAAVVRSTLLARRKIASNLVVHYREVSDRDGFIVTAFPISQARMWREFRNWQRLR